MEGHPDIHGYVRDSQNPRVFHPAWPECVYRVLRVTADKQLVVTGHCNGPLAAARGSHDYSHLPGVPRPGVPTSPWRCRRMPMK